MALERRKRNDLLLNAMNTVVLWVIQTKVKRKGMRMCVCERESNRLMGSVFEGWVRADQLDDLVGPLFITHPSDPTICLTVDDNDRLLAYPIPEGATETEPVIVNQVFVGARLLGTSNTFTIKSVHKKYLSSDKFGVVSADREAISGLEEWEPAITDAGVAFRNAHGKFLMVDQIAGGGNLHQYLSMTLVA